MDTKVGILSELCVKLEDKLNSCDGKLDTIISQYNFGFEKGVFQSCLNDDNLPRTNVDILLENRNIFDSQSEVFKKKKELISEWNNLLNQRKQAYWNAIRSEHLANTYEQWKQRENIILPMKYRVKSVRNEPEEETKIKVNLAMQKMEAEITLLRIRIPKYKTKYDKCDKEIQNIIEQRIDGEIKDQLKDLWQKEISREAAKSEQILDKKRKWLEEYEKTYGSETVKSKHKPKQERKQNSSKQEQTAKQQEKQLTGRTYADVVGTTGHQKNDTRRLNRGHSSNNTRHTSSQTRKSQSPAHGPTRHSHTNERQQNEDRSRSERSNSDSYQNHQQNTNPNHFLWKGPYHKGRHKTHNLRWH